MHVQFRERTFDESFPVECHMSPHPPHTLPPIFALLMHMFTGQNVSVWKKSLLIHFSTYYLPLHL